MLAKILAALAVPLGVVMLVWWVLRLTDHTAIPPFNLPATPSARAAVSIGSSPSAAGRACSSPVPSHFSGIAVRHNPSLTVAAYGKAFPGAQLKIVEFYNAFKKPFGRAEATQAENDGLIPFIQLNPRGVSVKQIASGVWDRHLRNYATAVRAFACTIILSFGHEMNGWWYSWGHRPPPKSSTTPAEFIAAWRHIHDIFRSVGAANVIWSWDPSHQHIEVAPSKVATPASQWYPGASYVNWIGLDGYLGYDQGGQRAQNFKEVFGFQLHDIATFAPGKPVYLAETGVAMGPALAHQVAQLFTGISTNHLMGLVWFDAISGTQGHDYRLGINPVVDAAYRANLASFLKKFPPG